MVKYTPGDLIELAKFRCFDIIIHQANCQNTMNKGIAKRIKEEFPSAYVADQDTVRGDKNKLGSFSYGIEKDYNLVVINLYGQFYYGGSEQNTNYEAIRHALKKIKMTFGNKGKRFGLPKIGSGLGKGEWTVIERIVEEELFDEDVTVVEYVKDIKT